MKVIYTEAALGDLAHIADWLTSHCPAIAPAVVNCPLVACTDSVPAAIVRLIQDPPPTLMLTVNPAPVGAVPTNATTWPGVRVAFNCRGGA